MHGIFYNQPSIQRSLHAPNVFVSDSKVIRIGSDGAKLLIQSLLLCSNLHIFRFCPIQIRESKFPTLPCGHLICSYWVENSFPPKRSYNPPFSLLSASHTQLIHSKHSKLYFSFICWICSLPPTIRELHSLRIKISALRSETFILPTLSFLRGIEPLKNEKGQAPFDSNLSYGKITIYPHWGCCLPVWY